jgi:phospholipase C
VNHLVLVLQENHTFDNYFARYCTAAAGSKPTCSTGPACCEAGPAHDPSGASPGLLDDAANAAHDPDHTQACELMEMNGGAMDRYVSGSACSNPLNFAYADAATARPYWDLAEGGALADRYFQPLAGQSSANDMYFARAQFVFKDNDFRPDAIGKECSVIPTGMTFPGPTIGDELDGAGVSWSFYIEGYQAAVDAVTATGHCAMAPADCPFGLGIYPCVYDPSDIPIAYYDNFKDNPRVMRDFAKLQKELDGSDLPQVSFVRGLGYHSEHPGVYDTISDGTTFVGHVIDAVEHSAYAGDTLVLVTWDEGGGYFDHIAPPPNGVDGQPYGTRVPLLVTGPFARTGTISHTTMEHSSVVKFIEWNWLAMQTGQLGGRDATVANLGSLLDPAATGVTVPE